MQSAGEFNQRITIQQATYAADAVGGRAATWSTWKRWWAGFKPMTGREIEFAKGFAATVTHKIVMRYCKGLLPTMRITLGTRIFAITAAIDVDERHMEHNLFCTEIL